MLFLDTHVLVWLYAADPAIFTTTARSAIRDEELVISPIVLLELQYLYEAGKIRTKADTIFDELHRVIGLRIIKTDQEAVVRAALRLSWTRDPFDRVIVAEALTRKAKLLSKDQKIRRHYPKAVW